MHGFRAYSHLVTIEFYALQEAIELIKHIQIIIILAICLLILTISANAATYYVDSTGSDLNDGSSGSPFATIQKGVDAASAGDTVYVRGGTYYELVNVNTSGLAGQPITVEGELGPDDERLAIVDGGTSVSGWVSAPEVASGVYKTTSIGFEPGSMVVEENGVVKDIPRSNKSNGLDYLANAADATEVTHYLKVEVYFWDGIEALYFYKNGTTYIRFRNGDNPNNKTIRASNKTSSGSCFMLSNKSYVTIKNFAIRAAWRGIVLKNSSTHHVIIENNKIYATGREKIYIESGTSDIDIKNNVLYGSGAWDLGSYKPGAWADGTIGSAPFDSAVKEHIYYTYKAYLSPSGSANYEDSGINLNDAGTSNIKIYGNKIYETLSGISLYGNSQADIYNNIIYKMSSVGTYFSENTSASIYNNLIYDTNINIRFGKCEDYSNNRAYFIYNNKFYNPKNIGDHTFFHYSAPNGLPSEWSNFYFYHNSFAGGYRVFAPSGYVDEHGGLKDTRFINNIFSSVYAYGNGGSTFYDDATMIEVFDYNWVGGSYSYYNRTPAWAPPNNIYEHNQFVWDNSSLPDFILPANSLARESGIDLSVNFTINGRTYPPLPGMKPGYYVGDKPDRGIFDADQIPPDQSPRIQPQNLRFASQMP
jgi:hypothetical protein